MKQKPFLKFFNKKKSFLKKFIFISIIFVIYLKENNVDIYFIRVAFYANSIKYGGIERVISLLINYISKDKRFIIYLITKKSKLEGEYSIPNQINRIMLYEEKISLYEIIEKNHFDILVYNFYFESEIKRLNKLKNIKIIYYDHSSFLYWIYQGIYKFNKSIYNLYRKCQYVLSLIPLENDYLFKRWGINSILIDNPSSFDYDSVEPSDLDSKNIIMIGRSYDPIKRFDLGIKAMKIIIKYVPNCEMNIISKPKKKYVSLIKKLKLEKFVRFVGFQKNIEIFLKNSSLHILPSLSESYCMALSETKIFGIPSIIIGLDYLALAKGGTAIIYDDHPDIIAKEAIKILKDDNLRKKLGKEARNSMKERKNVLIAKKWIKLLISVYKGNNESFIKISEDHDKMAKKEVDKILNNQLILLKKRKPRLKHLTLEKLKNFSLN